LRIVSAPITYEPSGAAMESPVRQHRKGSRRCDIGNAFDMHNNFAHLRHWLRHWETLAALLAGGSSLAA
jgi:hypothetical protein